MYQINTNNCVCCHNCATECPRQAIDYVGTKYQIDPDKCVECGLCARVCHTQSISDVDHPEQAVSHPVVEKECDLVVCGGGSGIVTAVRAAQLGKKVILVEKAKVLGGNTDYAHAYFPVYTKWHEAAGMPDCREEAIQHYRKATDCEIEEELFRTAVYGCGEFFDWLCHFGTCEEVYHLVNLGDVDAHGPIYGPGLLDFPNRIRDNLNCRDDAIGPGWGGTYVKYTMLEAIQNQRLDVEILTETAAKHLLTDEKGAISGLIAEDPGGEVRIKAKAVVLATGGFGKSDEKLKEFAPWFFEGETPIHRFSVPTDTGDGIDMLRELGVEPDPKRMFVSMFGPKHHPFNNILADMALEPEAVQVNLNGRRWVDETQHLHGMTAAIAQQPKEISWSIGGRDNWAAIAEKFLKNPGFAKRHWQFETWEEDLEEESKLELPVKKADTLEELAALCGMPADALVETVKQYNGFCAKGVDEAFGKDKQFLTPISEQGPYYAIYGQRFSEAAMGGLRVNGRCEITREDGTAIPGLYGVGDATSAMHRQGKLAVISELTWAVASAYTSGGNAAEYIDSL
ncbi:MAG: FAD-binding protein [Oscillospiraceae bacterium]|nr:FAD-binding protein [Oscillospiraceae bacterium]